LFIYMKVFFLHENCFSFLKSCVVIFVSSERTSSKKFFFFANLLYRLKKFPEQELFVISSWSDRIWNLKIFLWSQPNQHYSKQNVLLIKLAIGWASLEAPTGGASSTRKISISREFIPSVLLQHWVHLLQKCSYHIHQRIRFTAAAAALQRNGIEKNMKAEYLVP